MQIIAICPCGQQYNADSASIGSQLQCSTCGQVFIIAAAQSPLSNNPSNIPSTGYVLENRYADPGFSPNNQGHAPQNPSGIELNPHDPLASPQNVPAPGVPIHNSPTQDPTDPNNPFSGQQTPPFQSKRKKRNLKPILWAIGGGGAALVLILLGLFLFRSGSPRNGMNLTYLPANLSQFYFIDVTKVMDSPGGKTFVENDFFSRQYFASVEALTRLDLKEIQSITVGYRASDSENDFDFIDRNPLANLNFNNFYKFCGVVRTNSDYDKQKIIEAFVSPTEQEHSGQTYYQLESPKRGSGTALSVAFPNAKTILYGTEAEIKGALDGSKATNTNLFSNVEPNDHLVTINKGGGMGAFGFEKGGISVSFGNEITGRVWTQFESAEVARQFANAKSQFDRMAGSLPQMMPGASANQLRRLMQKNNRLNSLDIEVSGRTISTRFKGSDKQFLQAAMSQTIIGMLHRFSRHGLFADPINPNLTKKRNPAAQPKKAPNQANPVKKKAQPRRSNLPLTEFNTLPRYQPGVGQRIDLLDLVDIKKDVVKGTWAFENDELVCKSKNFRPRFQVPYQPPAEFDFKIVFKQNAPAGDISVILPNDGRSFSWTISAKQTHQFSVSRIKKNPSQVRTGTLIRPNAFHTLIVQRRAKVVKAVFDGRVLAEFAGDFGDLQTDVWTRIKNQNVLGFSCECETVIRELELTEVKGTGSFVE